MTCTTRCPQGFDLASFMDAIREFAIASSQPLPARDTRKFHTAFLHQIERYGRAYELGLVAEYKLATGHLLQDVDVAPGMLLRRKLAFLPHKIHGRPALRLLFKRSSGSHT
jgi:heterodisulfide reductase subunit C